jgi:hypothetical protein
MRCSCRRAQRADFERLNLDIVVRRADQVRDEATSPAATPSSRRGWPRCPTTRLQGALARLYTSAGDPANALKCYRVALARRPDDVGLLIAAIYAASGAKAWRDGEAFAASALRQCADDPALLAAVGRLYRAQGKLTLAAQYLQQALLAASPPPASGQPTRANVPRGWDDAMRRIGANPLPGTNPFEGKTAVDAARPSTRSGAALPAPGAPSWPSPSSYVPTVPYSMPPAPPRPTSYRPPCPRPVRRRAPPLPVARDRTVTAATAAAWKSDAPRPRARYRSSGGGGRCRRPNAGRRAALTTTGAGYVATPWPCRPRRVPRHRRLHRRRARAWLRPGPAGWRAAARRRRRRQPVLAQTDADPYAAPRYIPRPPAGYAGGRPAGQPPQPDGGANADAQLLDVASELAQVNREQTSALTGGLVFRNRTGEAGLSALTDIEAPIEGRIKAGNGHVVVTATPVMLDGGSASTDVPTLARFGAGLSKAAGGGSPGSQTASGVGVALGYEGKQVQAEIGATPVGFPYQDIVGGALQRRDHRSRGVFAGRDAPRGDRQRAVVRGRARRRRGPQVGRRDAQRRARHAELGRRHERHLRRGRIRLLRRPSRRAQLLRQGQRRRARILNDADRTLTVGVNATWMRFSKNQSYFTYGHGGYFSPQQYVIRNIPVEYSGRTGAFTYDLNGSIGVQHYRQNAVPYFPLDPGMQAQAAANAAAARPWASIRARCTRRTGKTGVAIRWPRAANIRSRRNSPSARPRRSATRISIANGRPPYLRYSFTPQGGLAPFPPRVFTSPYLAQTD